MKDSYTNTCQSSYLHDCHADKDSYPQDGDIQNLNLTLKLFFPITLDCLHPRQMRILPELLGPANFHETTMRTAFPHSDASIVHSDNSFHCDQSLHVDKKKFVNNSFIP